MTGAVRPAPVRRGLLAAVRFYQRAISPTRPPRCRFVPTCSAYAVEALEVHGAGRGTWLVVRRLLKCAPWHPGGVDLVPEPRSARSGTPEGSHSSITPEPAESAAPALWSPLAGHEPAPAAGGLRCSE